jgi:hypothetical protein
MRDDLKLRLKRVTKKLALVHRLRKVALATEEALIDRMSERSKKVLLDVRSKFFRASKLIEPALDEAGRAALAKAVTEVGRVVTNAGVVDQAAVEQVKSNLDPLWKELSRAAKGNMAVTHFFGSFERFVNIAMLGGLLQNNRMIERAKTDQKVRDKLYSVMEQMAQLIPQTQGILQKAISSVKVEAPPPSEVTPGTPTEEEKVAQQLDTAEREMRGITDQLARVIAKKAEELFGAGSEMADAIDENIFAIYNKRKVNPQLNRNRAFYQDALHLDHSPTKIDLADFLDTKEKKAIYLCYRSFVMALRALGVVQNAKAKPEVVAQNKKLQELVVKAQEILTKRKDTIVKYLQALKKPEKEQKEKERGIPKGTFSDFFENAPAA